jgi:hypothetical protein
VGEGKSHDRGLDRKEKDKIEELRKGKDKKRKCEKGKTGLEG